MSRKHVKLHARRWARARQAVFRRDGWRCAQCGRAGRLECDHIDRDWRGDPFAMSNLQSLCRTCHVEKTRQKNRRESTPAEAEWRAMVVEMLSKIDNTGNP